MNLGLNMRDINLTVLLLKVYQLKMCPCLYTMHHNQLLNHDTRYVMIEQGFWCLVYAVSSLTWTYVKLAVVPVAYILHLVKYSLCIFENADW